MTAHPHFDPIINRHTEQVGKTRIWLPMVFKKFHTHTPKPAEAKPSFRKVNLPPAKLQIRLLTSI